MRISQLRSFYRVAVHGSFTAAAQAANVSQPTVTSQVRDLEERYDVRLFIRSGRKVFLTEEGRGLLAIASRLFEQEREAVQFMQNTRELTIGHLRIAAVGPAAVTKLLSAFHTRYPRIKVSVSNANSQGALQSLKDYSSDVAVLSQRNSDPTLEIVPLMKRRIVIFVNQQHRFFGLPSIRLRDLHGELFIRREKGSMTREILDEALETAGVIPNIVMEIGTREAIREAVVHGIGIAAVSEDQFLPGEGLWSLPFSDSQIHNTTHVSILKERRQSRLVLSFMEVVHEFAEPEL